MIEVALALLLAAGVIGLALALREGYLRLDRPGGLGCSLRVRDGTVPGLGTSFRAGYLGPEPQHLLWRRLAWPGRPVAVPRDAVLLDGGRRARRGERWSVPSTFVIVPVTLPDGSVLELALPMRRVAMLAALLDGRPARSGLREAKRRAREQGGRTRFWTGPDEPGRGSGRR